MCRLLAFSSTERKSFLEVVGSSFTEFVNLSSEHKDGWGIASEGITTKDLNPANGSLSFDETVKDLKTDGALLHLRLASKGIAVDIDNNHPFTFGQLSFMHNGTIRPSIFPEQFISAKYKDLMQGTTDSERFFYAVLTQIDEHGLVEGVRQGVNLIRKADDYTALNIMIQTPETLIAVCEFKESNKSEWSSEDHYELRFTKGAHDVVVASTGWGNSNWNRLENHQMLVVNRENLEYSILPL